MTQILYRAYQEVEMKFLIFAVFFIMAVASAVAYPSGIIGVPGIATGVIATPAIGGIGIGAGIGGIGGHGIIG